MSIISICLLNGANIHKTLQLNIEVGGSIFIGSDEKCEIYLETDDLSVSKLHCSIFLSGNNYFLFKNDHSKKTLHNDKHFRDSIALKSGDKITVGINNIEILFDPGNKDYKPELLVNKKADKKRLFGIL